MHRPLISESKTSALSLFLKAESALSREEWGQAHSCFVRARDFPADPFLKAEILQKDAEALRALGRFRESFSSYRQAHRLYRKLRVPSEQLATQLGMSACLRILGQYAEARRLWKGPLRPLLPEVEMERALVARGLGRFLETRQRIAWVLSLLRKLKSPVRWAELQHAYWISGGLERFSGHFIKALQAYTDAAKWARELGDASAEAFALCGAAGVERVLGNDRDSLDHYRKAYRMLKKLKDPFGEAYGLCGQANALRTFGDAAAPLSLYRRSAGLYRRLGDESSEAFAHWGMGGSLRRLRQFRSARAAYRRALRLFSKSKDDRGIVMTHLGLGRLAEDQGALPAALASAARGRAVARHAKLRYETALARYEMGRMKNSLRPPVEILTPFGITPQTLHRWQDIP